MRICIDTNVYSGFKAGHQGIRRLLETADEVVVPTVVLGELLAGFYQGKHAERNKAELREFLSRPGITVARISEQTADRYGEIVRVLKKAGKPIPTNDIWIAAAVFETGTRLATFDIHFKHIPGIMTAEIP